MDDITYRIPRYVLVHPTYTTYCITPGHVVSTGDVLKSLRLRFDFVGGSLILAELEPIVPGSSCVPQARAVLHSRFRDLYLLVERCSSYPSQRPTQVG